MAPAFDKSDEFAIDKPASVVCPKLDAHNKCWIHDRLAKAGFKGCVTYDCLGAGQRVVQELFPGQSWRADPDLLPEMWQALTALRGLHELIQMLDVAARLPLSAEERRTLEGLQGELEPAGGWTRQTLADVDAGPVRKQAGAFLRSLGRHRALLE